MSSATEATRDPETAERPIVDNTNTKFDDVQPLERGDIWQRRIFAIACLIAVSADPLFFYIPLIDEANKCLKMDKKVRIAALLFRSLTDAIFIVQLIYETIQEFYPEMIYLAPERVQRSWKKKLPYLVKLAGDMILKHDIPIPWRSIVTFFLAILPIPQVLVLAVFLKKRGVLFVGHGMKFLNFFVLAQYVPRIFSLQQSMNKLKSTRLGIIIAYNFFLYILACHILGAMWYFFSIQREMSCWSHACEKNSTCSSTFYCDGSNSRNIGLLDQSCPINPSNATTFDFGIFLDSLKSRSNGSIDFSVKFFYSFWWGVRNLSSFGSNMQTSTYVWENCFATLITIFGLLLFLYLIGNNVQTHMQLRTERSEKEAAKAEETKEKMVAQLPYIDKWMRKFDLHVYLRRVILAVFKEKVNKNVDMRTLNSAYAVLPGGLRDSLRFNACINALHKAPRIARIANSDYRSILCSVSHKTKPVTYTENTYIIEAGKPIDHMVIVTKGMVLIQDMTSSWAGRQVERVEDASGCVYGQELLMRLSLQRKDKLSLSDFPISTESFQCQTKVEGFVITAADMMEVIRLESKHKPKKHADSDQVAVQEEVTASTAVNTSSITAVHPRRSMPTLEFDPSNYQGL